MGEPDIYTDSVFVFTFHNINSMSVAVIHSTLFVIYLAAVSIRCSESSIVTAALASQSRLVSRCQPCRPGERVPYLKDLYSIQLCSHIENPNRPLHHAPIVYLTTRNIMDENSCASAYTNRKRGIDCQTTTPTLHKTLYAKDVAKS